MISFLGRLFKKEPVAPAQPQAKTAAAPTPSNTDNYSKALLNTALKGNSAKERTSALKRIGQLLDEKQLELTQLTADTQNSEELLIACSYAATATDVLDTINDEEKLLELAVQAPTAPLRKAAAERVQSRPAIEQLLKHAKGKDKNVYKIAKTALDAYKQEDAELAEKHQYLASLCTDAERLAKRGFDHLFTHKFTTLEEDWEKANSDSTTELDQRFEQAIAKCQAIIDAEIAKSKAAALAEQQAKAAVSGITSASQSLLSIAASLLKANEISEASIANSKQAIEEQHNTVREFIRLNSSEDDSLKQAQKQAETSFITTKEAVSTLVDTLSQTGPLASLIAGTDPSAEPNEKTIEQLITAVRKVPELQSPEIDAAAAQLAEWRKARAQQEQANKALIRDVSELIRKANIAASSGQVRRARGIYKELCEKQSALQTKPLHIASKLEALEETMNKLGDWHDFAVTPKKEALIEKMNALHNSPLAPDDLADKIHDLQDEWKLLCKGGQNQDEALWEAFQQSADIAFAPCKEHFQAQAQIREDNAAQRRHLINELESYHQNYNWEQAAWKDVEHTLRVAKDAWKALWPVPRSEQKELQAQFDATLDKIYAPMNDAYEQVKQKKQQLITLAEKAADHQDPKQAAEDIKALQNQWKQAGRTFRKADQQLWQQFRATCDKVFEKRQAIFDEANAQKQEKLEQADALISDLKAILDKDGESLQTSGSDIEQLRTSFYAIDELPKNQVSQFESTLRAIDKKIANFRQAREAESYRTLLTLHAEVNRLKQTGDALEAIKEAIAAAYLPSGTKDELLALIANDKQPASDDAENALRLLCVRAEIATGKDSPESDKSLRMQYQVEALQENFGSAVDDSALSLCKAWIQIIGATEQQLATLKARFESTLFSTAKANQEHPISETA